MITISMLKNNTIEICYQRKDLHVPHVYTEFDVQDFYLKI